MTVRSRDCEVSRGQTPSNLRSSPVVYRIRLACQRGAKSRLLADRRMGPWHRGLRALAFEAAQPELDRPGATDGHRRSSFVPSCRIWTRLSICIFQLAEPRILWSFSRTSQEPKNSCVLPVMRIQTRQIQLHCSRCESIWNDRLQQSEDLMASLRIHSRGLAMPRIRSWGLEKLILAFWTVSRAPITGWEECLS